MELLKNGANGDIRCIFKGLDITQQSVEWSLSSRSILDESPVKVDHSEKTTEFRNILRSGESFNGFNFVRKRFKSLFRYCISEMNFVFDKVFRSDEDVVNITVAKIQST
ncbi:uncharacterized protein LOC143180579 [Calliopsis andreniformis]|uniref:uncharacterized protein LOC143180579 n=1 Tax=Calliopsis andreniformis TaxID=337506 RepID=UPI003FCEC796